MCPIAVIKRVNEIGTAQVHPKLLTFQDRHGYDNNYPDPYFQPIDHEIKGVVDDEPIEENVEDDHEDTNNDPANQGEEFNKADDPPENENEVQNENEVPTLSDEAEIEELPDALAAQSGPETTDKPKRLSGRIPTPVTIFETSFTGKKYTETTAITIDQTTIHPDAHMSLNEGQAWYHVVHYTMTQLSMKSGLKRWGAKVKQAVTNK